MHLTTAKRARFGEALRVHSTRKLPLALSSAVPEEVAWALNHLLILSAPVNEQTASDRDPRRPVGILADAAEAVSLVRNPALLRALLPVAALNPQWAPTSEADPRLRLPGKSTECC